MPRTASMPKGCMYFEKKAGSVLVFCLFFITSVSLFNCLAVQKQYTCFKLLHTKQCKNKLYFCKLYKNSLHKKITFSKICRNKSQEIYINKWLKYAFELNPLPSRALDFRITSITAHNKHKTFTPEFYQKYSSIPSEGVNS